jgi:hypothetical protein
VRFGPEVADDFKNLNEWGDEGFNLDPFPPAENPKAGAFFRSNALSGGERHRLFMNRDGNFKDLTLVSGADFREDGRGFVLFDFDHDGFLDMGVTAPQRPRFRILRNTIGDDQNSPNRAVFIQLQGGHTGTESQTDWSPRDAFGATVLATIGKTKRLYQLSCGEGLSSQNSKWMHVGVGDAEKIDRLDVTWPSGKKTFQENVKAGERITLFENAAQNK